MKVLHKRLHQRLLLLVTGAVLLLPVRVIARADGASLFDMPLEDAMQINIISALKKETSLFTAPAAAFVISDDDIRRSGATTIPDILRIVPGGGFLWNGLLLLGIMSTLRFLPESLFRRFFLCLVFSCKKNIRS